MIHIDYPGTREPDKEWLKKAKELTDALCAEPDRKARNKIIDDNSAFWGEIKDWLEEFSGGKCWFSEARDSYSHWQVEHFRPKKEAKEPARDGYWWRAFDHLNYRLCGSVGNAKKGSYFPLRPGTAAAQRPEDDCDSEAPFLLDPTIKGDVTLLTFAERGIAVPAEAEGWPHERAKVSIERYKLNRHPPLARSRERVWNECSNDAIHLEMLMAQQAKSHSPTRQAKIDFISDKLTDRTRPTSEFSSVARAFLLQHPRQSMRNLIA
jgi:hypothetical protein